MPACSSAHAWYVAGAGGAMLTNAGCGLALELFPIEVDRQKSLALSFIEQLHPTKRADWSDVALDDMGEVASRDTLLPIEAGRDDMQPAEAEDVEHIVPQMHGSFKARETAAGQGCRVSPRMVPATR